MAKHKRKEKKPIDNNLGNNNFKNNNSNPFGIDPTQLMNMLGGNFDINSLLASMNIDGLNLANLAPLANMAGINLGNFGNLNNMNSVNNMNSGNNMNDMNNINVNSNINDFSEITEENNINNKKIKKNNTHHNKKEVEIDDDSNLEMLMSLRGFVHPEKVNFIDKIIDLYKSGAFKDI